MCAVGCRADHATLPLSAYENTMTLVDVFFFFPPRSDGEFRAVRDRLKLVSQMDGLKEGAAMRSFEMRTTVGTSALRGRGDLGTCYYRRWQVDASGKTAIACP